MLRREICNEDKRYLTRSGVSDSQHQLAAESDCHENTLNGMHEGGLKGATPYERTNQPPPPKKKILETYSTDEGIRNSGKICSTGIIIISSSSSSSSSSISSSSSRVVGVRDEAVG
jgi:hypothetical protein